LSISEFLQSPAEIGRLIEEARGGSEEAIGRLLQFSRQYLLVIAAEHLPADLQAKGGASDLVQETHLDAVCGFGGFRGHSAAELLGWLREILLNNLNDFTRRYSGVAKRRANREVPIDGLNSAVCLANLLASDQSSPSSHFHHHEQAAAIEAAIGRLARDYRQVVLWRNRDGCSFEEIAERLGRSIGAVRKLWSRAIQQLQEQVESPHEQPRRGN
jgi:RNA polymerase sigma-70 factor (ECF subfamily)